MESTDYLAEGKFYYNCKPVKWLTSAIEAKPVFKSRETQISTSDAIGFLGDMAGIGTWSQQTTRRKTNSTIICWLVKWPASAIESKSVFKSRATQIGISGAIGFLGDLFYLLFGAFTFPAPSIQVYWWCWHLESTDYLGRGNSIIIVSR